MFKSRHYPIATEFLFTIQNNFKILLELVEQCQHMFAWRGKNIVTQESKLETTVGEPALNQRDNGHSKKGVCKMYP